MNQTDDIHDYVDLYKYIFSIQTGNDFWKRCLCQGTQYVLDHDIMQKLDYMGKDKLTDDDIEAEKAIIPEYSQMYDNETCCTFSEGQIGAIRKHCEKHLKEFQYPSAEAAIKLNIQRTSENLIFYAPIYWHRNPTGIFPELAELGSGEKLAHKVEEYYWQWRYYLSQALS